MKIRQGFVSNSSSSSFCVVLTKKDYEKAVASLTEDQQKLVKEHEPESKIIGGINIVMFTGGRTEESVDLNGEWFSVCDEVEWGDKYEHLDKLSKIVDNLYEKAQKYPHLLEERDY
jgi:hypothetical protein